MSARFEIVRTPAEQPFHTRLVAENGEPISSSENHADLYDAKRAIKVEAELFGYLVVAWKADHLVLVHEQSGLPLQLPVLRVDELGGAS
jgi:uncharacterized protein YegP (UPF0339 family)